MSKKLQLSAPPTSSDDVAAVHACPYRSPDLPDLLHGRDGVDKKLFGQFRFSVDHKSFQQTATAAYKLVDGAVRQADRVTEINRTDVIQLTLGHQRIQYLSQSSKLVL